jgi:DNA polymerase-3 subunit alpha
MSMFEMGGFDAPQLGSVLHPEPDDLASIPQKELLSWEKELAGAYLSNHPIQKFLPQIKAAKTTLLGEVTDELHGQQVMVAGLINSIRPHQTKRGDPMAFVEIEDLQAIREIILFPRTYEATRSLLVLGNLIVVKGKVDAPEGRPPKILADSVANELTIYGAVGETTAPYQAAPPPPPPAPPEPSMFAESPPAAAAPAMPPEPPSNFITEPATPPPAVPASNGHANGHANGHSGSNGVNGHGSNGHQPEPKPDPANEPATPEPATPTVPPSLQPGSSWLHVTLPRTGDLGQDKHRLRMVYTLLTDTPGSDGFSIYIPNGNGKVRIDFPNASTRYTAKLQQHLTMMLGAKSVRVEPVD